MKLVMNADEVDAYIAEVFPQVEDYHFKIESLEIGKISVSMKTSYAHLRPGGTISGPTMFTLADCASYLIVLAHIGKVALAVTTNLNINFISKPEGDLIADATLLKLGKRLAVCEIAIKTKEQGRLVAHATATYSIPPK